MRETSSSTTTTTTTSSIESSRGGALVSAVVAVLEKQQQQKQQQQQQSESGVIKKTDLFANLKSYDDSKTSKQINPTNVNNGIPQPNVIIKEFIYKDVTQNPFYYVKQKDPKLMKNTSYVIVKENEFNNHTRSSPPSTLLEKNKDDVDDISNIEKCSPITNRITKNKPYNIQTLLQETANSGTSSCTNRIIGSRFKKTTRPQKRNTINNNNIENSIKLATNDNNLQDTADRNFEKAIKNFDRTAEDVQNYVLKNRYDTNKTSAETDEITIEDSDIVYRNKIESNDRQKDRFSSTTDYTSNVSDDFDDDVDDDDNDDEDDDDDDDNSTTNSSTNTSDDDSNSERIEHIINEGLETITEEDRTAGSSFKSTIGEIDNIRLINMYVIVKRFLM